MNERKKYIDITRGFAIILVTIGHVAGKQLDGDFNTVSVISVIFKFIYSFHMPLFFFLSGLVSSGIFNKSVKRNISGKLRRLIVPYFIWTFIFVLFKRLTSAMLPNTTDWNVLIWSPFDPTPLQYWFLYVLFFMGLLHVIVLNITKNPQKTNYILLAVGLVLVLINPLIDNIWISNYFFGNFFYYILGSTFSINHYIENHSSKVMKICAPLFLVSEILYLHYTYTPSFIKHYLVFFTSFLGAIVFTTLFYIINSRRNSSSLKWLNYNGMKSMEIYCYHPIIAALVRVVIDKMFPESYEIAFLIIISLITVLICDLISFTLRNVRIYKALFGEALITSNKT